MPPPNLKQHLTTLSPAPIPDPDPILEVRTGKIGRLGGKHNSAIDKQLCTEPVYVTPQGLTGDQHFYPDHRESHRAVHQYASKNYLTWQAEKPDLAHLFRNGGFGENFVASELTEESVCIGDVWRVGSDRNNGLLLQVSEPRNPCYKLNTRFQRARALPRISKTGRVGWNFRVLRPGFVKMGDVMELVERPNPCWSVMNVVRVLHGKDVEPRLYEECLELEALSPYFHNMAIKRLAAATRTYRLVEAEYVTPRVRQLTFALKDGGRIKEPAFKPYAHAQISFGPEKNISRCYSIVDGNLERFTLGVSLDARSRGGSEYLHKKLQLGDQIKMGSGLDAAAVQHEEQCAGDSTIDTRVVIIGGIGVTAFLPAIRQWKQQGLEYEVHYAFRSMNEAAYECTLPRERTTLYDKSGSQRLKVGDVVPKPGKDGIFHARIFCCGPPRMMEECRKVTDQLGYPEHLVHFESFGNAAGEGEALGSPFEVEVHDSESGREVVLDVPEDKSLLRVLNDAGFDVMSSCQSGGCGICKVALCSGKAAYNSTVYADERPDVMMPCVDRAAESRIAIEVD